MADNKHPSSSFMLQSDSLIDFAELDDCVDQETKWN